MAALVLSGRIVSHEYALTYTLLELIMAMLLNHLIEPSRHSIDKVLIVRLVVINRAKSLTNLGFT